MGGNRYWPGRTVVHIAWHADLNAYWKPKLLLFPMNDRGCNDGKQTARIKADKKLQFFLINIRINNFRSCLYITMKTSDILLTLNYFFY